MPDSYLLNDLIANAAGRTPDAAAVISDDAEMAYGALSHAVTAFASGLMQLGLGRGERVGIYLEKRSEAVVASFGTAAAGCVFVPLNPVLRPDQVGYILRDCNARVLVTSPERMALLRTALTECPDLRCVVVTASSAPPPGLEDSAVLLLPWVELLAAPGRPCHRVIDIDVCAILYTSGSTGQPKGVVLSHRNMVAGAKSVAGYLGNQASDTLLAALPLSFDAGFSQLTTAFCAGARVVLLNYLLPRDVLHAMRRHQVTGLTAVPPLYIQLARLEWPSTIDQHLRYFANTGGHMPRETLTLLRQRVPSARPFLMYGLTEAFRSTYLPPEEIDRRPDSIGKAIPNAEILVLREDGTSCDPDEPGELVHRGALVGMGYWNDPVRTAERYKPLPAGGSCGGSFLALPEFAVFSGDWVRKDADGFLYFIGRRDDMIKTSGYRVSPTEVEEILYASRLVAECVAFGVDDPVLGQAIQVVATPAFLPGVGATSPDDLAAALQAECKVRMPAYMLPAGVAVRDGPLPRSPNGKLDRKRIVAEWRSNRYEGPDGHPMGET